ncbi:MAG: hypothetical protein QM770_16710 [Tepidisphaeraceae bacterium]
MPRSVVLRSVAGFSTCGLRVDHDEQAFIEHDLHHGGDGRECDLALLAKPIVDVAHARGLQFPEDSEDLEFGVGRRFFGRACHEVGASFGMLTAHAAGRTDQALLSFAPLPKRRTGR